MATNIPAAQSRRSGRRLRGADRRSGAVDDDLIGIVPGPDFPTGGLSWPARHPRRLSSGRGSIIMRGKVRRDATRDGEAIIITEIPYQVNKATMVERIGDCGREKKIEGIAALRDESDRDGFRFVIELRREAMPRWC